MASASIARSTSLRLAAFYTLLFLLSFLGANVVGYNMVATYLYERLDANVTERFREIASAYDTSGIDGAVAMVQSHGPAIRGQETLYTLKDADNVVLAGNIDMADVPPGFSTRAPTSHNRPLANYRLYRKALGNYDLTVGISYDDTNRLRRIALVSFGWATAIVLAAGLGGGAVLAFRTRRRIGRLSQAMKAVGAGELSRRLPVSSRRDDIDTLAMEVNDALGQLQASVAAMTQVTTDIAHDLKTPIGRLFLTLETALECGDHSATRPLLEKAMEEVTRITGTFEGLLRISQIESGARRSRFAQVNLAELVSDIHDIYRDIAVDAGRLLDLSDDHHDVPSWVWGDIDLLKQMCVNLLVNAMRHTPQGARIVIGVAAEADALILIVSDNGPGIPEEERDKVFKRFYRLEKSRTTEGTGLGLSLVKAISDMHGAVITLTDNRPGLVVSIAFSKAS
ncbi:sensor histidine kinase [Rhizobiales bacterium 3FA27D7]|jgi:signal transduction histidine kinase|uniref:sensor histidine kinase n=1 Tax=Mesorhizobium sp. 2RAF21 TaxID=3232995 RepID=UPI0010F96173